MAVAYPASTRQPLRRLPAVRRVRRPIRLGMALVVVLAALLPMSVRSVHAAVPDPADDPTRVSLSTLQPRTYNAKYDLGRVYRDGCHVARTTTSPIHCTYGKRDGTRVVVVIGDSVMAQWWAAIDGAARRAGWRVVWMTKTACPAADVTLLSGSRYAACDTWRRNVLTKVRNLARVDVLVMSGSSRSTLLRRADWSVISHPDAERAEWEAGYRRTVDRVAGQVRRVVILRDTPHFRFMVPACLVSEAGWTLPCSGLRTSSLDALHWQAEIAVDARYAWVRATDMSNWICQPTRCWPVTSNRLLRYRDAHHLTNTYATALAPAMYSRLRWLMR